MKATKKNVRRLILGMSVEDAQSKFDSPESRLLLRLSHERHNQGVLRELQLAQHARNKLSPERKCHINRFCKPTCKGFQAYIKAEPDDFVVRELWPEDLQPKGTKGSPTALVAGEKEKTSLVPYQKVKEELQEFLSLKKTVLTTLREAAEVVAENVLSELTERRDSGSLVSGQQKSVVDRLVDQVEEAKDKGYRSLSSSSHLLEPVEMSLTLYAKKDKEIADAFKSVLLSFPAREGDISFSLWVAGALIANETLAKEFPYHLAKYVLDDSESAHHHNRLPKVIVEVYFSPELYQVAQLIGDDGVFTLRQFIGRTIMQQHEPSPTSQSILLNANYKDRAVFQLYNPSLPERVRLPWLNKTRTKVASISGVVMSAEDITPGSVSMEKRKEAMVLLWRAWGHLIKDFHVSGDLDFLCVAVDRFKEAQENEEHIRSVRQIDEKVNEEQHALEVSNGDLLFRSGKHNAVSPHKGGKKSAVRHYVPLSADFAVVECCLERKGLPHNMVLEDITKALTDMQTQSLEALRFALIDEIEMLDEEIDLSSVVPVLYAPKIVVTHAGVIEKGTHSYQRIRIRGSCLAHIETLANALRMENYFTDGEVPSVVPEEGRPLEVLPENLSFTPRHAATPHGSGSRRLVGHRLRSSSRGGAGHEGEQVVQAYEDSMISQEERDFWRENYYRLSSLKLLYHNRIDARDALLNKGLNPRLSEHIRVINSKLLGDEAEGEDTRRVTQRRKKSLEVGQIPPEKMFEYYCTDCEAETAMWDLKVGDSHGYDYNVRLRKIPAKDVDYVTPAVHSLQGKGFINYFGTSRFSSYTRHNMHPGLHLLKGEFRAAANVIVQQFYVDAAVEAERRRTGSAFPSNGKQFPRMVDFAHQSGRRTISEHGTALQKVLNNALQASLFLNDQRRPDGLLEESELGLDDPCAEAFLNLIGTNACRVIVHEFLSFVWNDIVNQRMKRYGTFALLPGDIVRRKTEVPVLSAQRALLDIKEVRQNPNELTFVTKEDIENKLYSPYDVLLPLPGAGCILPQNHTTDLYIVTLRKYGINFNPEDRVWDIFYPREPSAEPEASTSVTTPRQRRAARAALAAASPYHHLTTSFGKIEEELAYETVFNESLVSDKVLATDAYKGKGPKGVDAQQWRKDMRKSEGNPLGIAVDVSYRAPLATVGNMKWHLEKGLPGTPLERWGVRRQLEQGTLTAPAAAVVGETPKEEAEEKEVETNPEELNPFALPNGGELITGAKPQKKTKQPTPNKLGALSISSLVYSRPPRKFRTLPYPKTPYWISGHDHTHLDLHFRLPTSSYSSMLLRELTKSDVNVPEVVPLQGVIVGEKGVLPGTIHAAQLIEQQRRREAEHRQYLNRRRMRRAHFVNRPRAMNLALLHQQVFRSSGVRQSLIPTLRSYDSVSK